MVTDAVSYTHRAETIDYGIHCMADLTTFIEKEDAVYLSLIHI